MTKRLRTILNELDSVWCELFITIFIPVSNVSGTNVKLKRIKQTDDGLKKIKELEERVARILQENREFLLSELVEEVSLVRKYGLDNIPKKFRPNKKHLKFSIAAQILRTLS